MDCSRIVLNEIREMSSGLTSPDYALLVDFISFLVPFLAALWVAAAAAALTQAENES